MIDITIECSKCNTKLKNGDKIYCQKCLFELEKQIDVLEGQCSLLETNNDNLGAEVDDLKAEIETLKERLIEKGEIV